ncbi:predicted protein [Thalassiosira pseudonana CCMP1335]|uniref:Plastid lipid-associated protein/fibrillin conserved domain-containing protein n=1 Tax=Thalassiosira pseudonana TaxID=35128 RepID=B8BT43_THAPS|nr:predicted protein [Thalassiosira pseudonana CCMP1335]EED95655.1 predicted protein [Thalassiosira pseudonana CCMP1335]|eukprot:g466.t1 g466   contig10:95115-95984(+)
MTRLALLVCSSALALTSGFTTPQTHVTLCHHAPSTFTLFSTAATSTAASSSTEIQEAAQLLYRAAETKLENPDRVLDALELLEKDAKQQFKANPAAFSQDILNNISGDWRLIFTTGTKERQQKSGGRVNYFPLKAIQKFDATVTPKLIENAIYAWDLPLIRFSGDFDFNERKRKLEFDFDLIEILGLFKIKLGRKEVAKIGASTGLGSKGNEKLAENDRRAFFDWISADEKIATARGGGGGLALWKRVDKRI